jgi:hypothetical protein
MDEPTAGTDASGMHGQEPATGAPPPRPSYRDLPPLETGGVEARQGFLLQDHVATSCCLEMLSNDAIEAVWCETHDDIVVIKCAPEIRFEFVQVKGTEPNQLWTVALACGRTSGRANTSLVERSFQQDRGREATYFRIVTTRQVNNDLAPLRHSLASEVRAAVAADIAAIESLLAGHLGQVQSENGNGLAFWLSRVVWQDGVTVEYLRTCGHAALRLLLDQRNELAAPDRVDELYVRLLAKVQSAATADPLDRAAKRITRPELLHWFSDQLQQMSQSPAAGITLKVKLLRAQIDAEAIANAVLQRMTYAREQLSPQYMEVRDRQRLQAEVSASLQLLRIDLDEGRLTDDGPSFHRRCMRQLKGLPRRVGVSATESMVQGCMYDLTDRCSHRFTRVAS